MIILILIAYIKYYTNKNSKIMLYFHISELIFVISAVVCATIDSDTDSDVLNVIGLIAALIMVITVITSLVFARKAGIDDFGIVGFFNMLLVIVPLVIKKMEGNNKN